MRMTVFDQDGDCHELINDSARSIMEIIREAGLDIAAQCGGCASCGTCHVYVEANWLPKLPDKERNEIEMLELATEPRAQSRLSCQLKANPALDGLVVTLAPGTEF